MDPFPPFQPDDPPWIRPEAAYVHIPFCAHRCGYCDFAIATGKDERIEPYLDALEAEMSLLGRPRPVKTVFVGGGTPSHLPPLALQRLGSILRRWLDWSPGAEVSLEANPESLTREKVDILAEAGFTRISLGAQSFSRETLGNLDRPHDPQAIAAAVQSVRQAGLDPSIDLIFGAPGQTLTEWSTDLEESLALGLTHLSTYGLTYERGTPLEKRVRLGTVRPVSEDAERDMYALAMDRLPRAGLGQYEISNFAMPGKESVHNEVYWANEAHWGFGMGASGYMGWKRQLNTRDLDRYIRLCLSGQRAVFQEEVLPDLDRALETMAQNLRRAAGVERERFREQTGFSHEELFESAAQPLSEQGLLIMDERGMRLSQKGRFVADAIVERLMRAGMSRRDIK